MVQGWTNGNASLMTPNPDWYTTVLFKQLMGTQVLNTTAAGDPSTLADVDVQFWCGSSGGVVLAWLNTGSDDVQAELPASLVGDVHMRVGGGACKRVHRFVLQCCGVPTGLRGAMRPALACRRRQPVLRTS